jgi:hypothetical protein
MDHEGNVWAADQAYVSGSWGYTQASAIAAFPGYTIENTYDGPLFCMARLSPSYRFDVPGPGTYRVKLLFSENVYGLPGQNGVGSRVFDIRINGVVQQPAFDILQAAGSRARRAVLKAFQVTLPAGGSTAIVIDTLVNAGAGSINAIEVSSQATLTDVLDNYAKASPSDEEVYRINCGGTKSVDSDNTLWMADEPFDMCRRWGYTGGISQCQGEAWGTPAEYRAASWREGDSSLRYDLSLPNGSYQVKLIFQENVYRASGQRVFDVAANGTPVVSGLDVFQRTGFATPLELSVSVAVTREQLEISFPSVQAGQAMISALEVKVSSVSDQDFLDFVEHRALEYFITGSGPFQTLNTANGLVADRMGNFKSQAPGVASIATVGFRLAALAVAKTRGWMSAADAQAQAQTLLTFVAQAPVYGTTSQYCLTHYHGFYFHFLDLATGGRMGTTELSPMDSTLLFAGVMLASQAFPGTPVASLADTVLQRAEWPWFVNNNLAGYMRMCWSPETGFSTDNWVGYNEDALMYLLGIGSSTYPVSPVGWFNMARGWDTSTGVAYMTQGYPTSLFTHVFPQCYLDLRNAWDDKNNYYANTGLAIQANQAFCSQNALGYATYQQGGWCLSACDSPLANPSNPALNLYKAYWAAAGQHDGTVNPSMAAASVSFNPATVLPALRKDYFRFKHFAWGRFGFTNAYNLNAPTSTGSGTSGQGWCSPDVIGIDLGALVLGIENYRTGWVWQAFNQHPWVQNGKARIRFSNPGIEDFDNDCSCGDSDGQRDASWTVSNSQDFTLAIQANVAGDPTNCLKVTYNKPVGEEWAFIDMSRLSANANMTYYLGHSQLSFYASGSSSVLLKFRDKFGHESGASPIMSFNAPGGWQRVTWDYSQVAWGSCDPKQVEDILLFIAPGATANGVAYFDNFTLGALSDPPSWNTVQAASEKKYFPNVKALAATMETTTTPTPTVTVTPDLLRGRLFMAYPNPAKDHVVFAWQNAGAEKARIEIFNLKGERVAELKIRNSNSLTWSTGQVSNGIYFYQIILTVNGREERQAIKKIAIAK